MQAMLQRHGGSVVGHLSCFGWPGSAASTYQINAYMHCPDVYGFSTQYFACTAQGPPPKVVSGLKVAIDQVQCYVNQMVPPTLFLSLIAWVSR